MRWKSGRRSENVEDRRGARASRGVKMAGIGGIGAVVLAIASSYLGVDLQALLGKFGGAFGGGQGVVEESPGGPIDPNDELANFVSVVLGDTETVWNELFRELGKRYEEPTLVLFRDGVNSACGFAQSAVGPFYCPADKQVYIDLAFYNDLKNRHGAPGDFAQAYVIAHEVGHHVQNLLGTSTEVRRQQQRLGETERNQLSVRLELQADFYAGVWAHHAQRSRDVLEPGDLEEALRAASAIGDDRLQREARGHVTPDSFTHGTSEQRVRWFRKGFQSGDVKLGDTFRARDL